MRIHNIRFGFLIAFVCFVSVTWITHLPDDGATDGPPALQTLYERLAVAERLGGQVSHDLSGILAHLKNISEAHANITLTDSNTTVNNVSTGNDTLRHATVDPGRLSIDQPNIYQFLPHLRGHRDSLKPNVVLGQGRKGVSIVLGIPTVKRDKQSYLVSTLSSLLFSLTSEETQDLLIIVFVAETDSAYVNSVAETIMKSFPKEVRSGLMEVVSPSQFYYPDFSILRETFGDSKDRVKWRTKQNLDFSFLMLYAQDKGTYYVQLEDDIYAKTGYYQDMKAFATRQSSKQWLYLEFSQLGFIGKMFRTADLPMIAEFFLMFHRDKPIDWLLDHILWVKVCNPEKDAKHCNEQKSLLKVRFKPSLFQHVGLHSSLSGKIQNLKDKDFGKQPLFLGHSNPSASLSSSMKHYQQHSVERAYRGEDFYWAVTPVSKDYVLINFTQPVHIKGFLFRSGNMETSRDRFHNTTVEVLPTNASDNLQSAYKESDKGFYIIGRFEDGMAEGKVAEALQPISALRLVVQSDADVWAVLSEIHLKV